MAEKARCPIIPVSINNSRGIWEDHMPFMKKTHVIIEFGKPIHLDTLSKEDRKFLGAYVSAEIKRMYDHNKTLI